MLTYLVFHSMCFYFVKIFVQAASNTDNKLNEETNSTSEIKNNVDEKLNADSIAYNVGDSNIVHDLLLFY